MRWPLYGPCQISLAAIAASPFRAVRWHFFRLFVQMSGRQSRSQGRCLTCYNIRRSSWSRAPCSRALVRGIELRNAPLEASEGFAHLALLALATVPLLARHARPSRPRSTSHWHRGSSSPPVLNLPPGASRAPRSAPISVAINLLGSSAMPPEAAPGSKFAPRLAGLLSGACTVRAPPHVVTASFLGPGSLKRSHLALPAPMIARPERAWLMSPLPDAQRHRIARHQQIANAIHGDRYENQHTRCPCHHCRFGCASLYRGGSSRAAPTCTAAAR